MEQKKIDALVLSSVPHKEAGKRLVLLTPEGKIFASVAGVAKPKAKLAFASQPFCLGEFLLASKSGFVVVTNCTAIDSFFSVLKDFDKYVVGSMILEIANIVSKPEEDERELFVLAIQSLKLLAYSSVASEIVFCKFMLEVLRVSGYFLEFSKCVICDCEIKSSAFFDIEKGGMLCRNCFGNASISVSSGVAQFLKNCCETDFAALGKISASSAAVVQSKNFLISCFENQVGEQIKSKNLI